MEAKMPKKSGLEKAKVSSKWGTLGSEKGKNQRPAISDSGGGEGRRTGK